MKTLYFVAGEASADNHGAALIRALQRQDVALATASPSSGGLRFIGRGGPQMKSVAGAEFQDWIEKSGVLGLWEVIKQYGYFRKQFDQALREIDAAKPNAVVLIDYPGFNLRLARALSTSDKATLDKPKIIYYISPQVWAWNRGRIKKMARWLDLMLCIFPFEAELYNESGLRTIFVGHPMVERLSEKKIAVERDPSLIGLFPGSRAREVRKIFPILIETARKLRETKPNLHFQVAAASDRLANVIKAMIGVEEGHIEIKVGQTAEIMQRAFVGIVASGSATLEAAYFRLPFVLIYKVAWPTYFAGRLLVKVKYLGMPNVLADKEVVPEFIQHRAKSNSVAEATKELAEDAHKRQQMISEFDKIAAQLGESGASEHAAKAIIAEIS